MKPGKTGLARILFATKYSMQGLKAAWIHEASFRQELVVSLILSFITFFLPVSMLEQLALIGCLFLIVIVELINSAIEAIVDKTGSEWHELSGRAKDIGSAAVLVALIFSGLTWTTILFSKLF
jgi:diacylglycerol kinase (ATP)